MSDVKDQGITAHGEKDNRVSYAFLASLKETGIMTKETKNGIMLHIWKLHTRL